MSKQRIENFIKVLSDGYYSSDIHNDIDLIIDLIHDKKLNQHMKLLNDTGFYYEYCLTVLQTFEVMSNGTRKTYEFNTEFKLSAPVVRRLEMERLIRSRQQYGITHYYHDDFIYSDD